MPGPKTKWAGVDARKIIIISPAFHSYVVVFYYYLGLFRARPCGIGHKGDEESSEGGKNHLIQMRRVKQSITSISPTSASVLVLRES